MSLSKRAALSYLAAVLIPLAIGAQWNGVFPTLQSVPGYIYLLIVALMAPFVIDGITGRGARETREANERYRTLVELAPDGIVVTDDEGKIVFANPALARIVGAAEASSLIGRNSLDFLPPEDQPNAERRVAQLMSGQSTPWIVTRAIRLDGGTIHVERAGVPLRRGNRRFAQGFVRDVTEREESRRRLQALFDNAIDGIVFIDSGGHYIDANPAACELLGYTREELRKMKVGDLTQPDQREDVFSKWDDVQAGRKLNGEGTLHLRDGRIREIEYRVSPNVLPGLNFSILHDVSAAKNAERSLAQLSTRLLRSQDDERRRIARQLHDTTAQNLAALRLDLSRISRSADSTIKVLVDESIALVDQSIMEVRTLSYLLHPPLIDEAGLLPSLRWFTRGFEERSGIKVTLDAPESIDRLSPESETAVFRIVQEALTNVQRHSGSAVAHIRIARNQDGIGLEVSDEGNGLPKHLRDQGDAALAGAGVGIAGMQQRVKELGGNMRIESRGRGTTLAVTLPIRKES